MEVGSWGQEAATVVPGGSPVGWFQVPSGSGKLQKKFESKLQGAKRKNGFCCDH